LKHLANQESLRQNQTDVEPLLWQKLRNRPLLNFKFRQQLPIDPFIVDFSCLELKLIIELDGSQHFEQTQYDNETSLYLAQRGFPDEIASLDMATISSCRTCIKIFCLKRSGCGAGRRGVDQLYWLGAQRAAGNGR
jgi:hypothetical protein